MEIFKKIESKVQFYARSFPFVIKNAKGEYIYDEDGNRYLDFLSGSGALNYGHNNSVIKNELLKYINDDGITHSLDMHSNAKKELLYSFQKIILKPRNYEYMIQFPGPTGTNAVEAAMKLARNVTGRHNIIAFTNSFHGVTLGALSATGSSYHRDASGINLNGIIRMPYDGYLGNDFDTTDYLNKSLLDLSSGIDKPAAVIVETVQGEGGLNVASYEWLRNLERICKKNKILLIVDDIQAGCGRTGSYFSFEESGIQPDIVTLSKSISGYGLPFAIVLSKPKIDQWKPGEHNGTFRGNNLAFVTTKATIEHYWSDESFPDEIRRKGEYISKRLKDIVKTHHKYNFSLRGRGMFLGINCIEELIAKKITELAFKNHLLLETCGANNNVIKIMCPLTISDESLVQGMNIIEKSFNAVLETHPL